MPKRKYPSELNSRTIRVNIGDWQWLNSLSQRLGITVAQAFHKVITELDRDQDHKAPVQRTQIPMPAFRVTAPVVAQVSLNPILKARSISTNVQLRATIAKGGSSNGAKQV